MKLLALMPIAAAAVSVSLDADLNAMKESLRGIALTAQKEGKQINQTTINVVEAMLNNINSTLVDALHVDKSSAQAALTAAWQAVEDCEATRTDTFETDIAAAETNSTTAHDEFIDCKNGEAGSAHRPGALLQKKRHGNRQVPTTVHDFGYNFSRTWNIDNATTGALGDTSHEVHAHSEEYRLCKLLNDTVKNFANLVDVDGAGHAQTKYADYCENHDPNDWTDLFRTNEKLVTESYKWFSALDDFESEHAADYKQKRENCHLARHRHVLRVVECNKLQHLAEQKYCTWANAIEEECHLYETCYVAQYATWETANTTAQDLEKQMKLQQHALEHLLCYGNEIMQGNTDLSNCDELACDKCDDYSLSYVPPHSEISCSEERANKPCDDAWINDYMGEFVGSDHPLEACQACNAPNLIDWSAPAGP